MRTHSMSRYRIGTTPSLRVILVGVVLLASTGCQTVLKPLHAGSEVRFEPGQGLLILETFSNSDIELVRLVDSERGHKAYLLRNIPDGHQINLVVMPEGNYRWDRIYLPGWTYRRRSYPVKWKLKRDDQWRVSVKAGHVNYPGMVVLNRSAWSYLSWRVLNRSGELLGFIEDLFPGLLAEHAVRYGGKGRDDFLEHYREMLRSRDPAPATTEEEAPVAPGDL